MKLIKEIGTELVAMFVGDARLAVCVLALIAGVAVLKDMAQVGSLAAGAVLVLGCLAILLESVRRGAAMYDR
jgi:thiamine transporter ThiT